MYKNNMKCPTSFFIYLFEMKNNKITLLDQPSAILTHSKGTANGGWVVE